MAGKSPEHSVTPNIIKKIHLTLSNNKTGEDVLEFLKSTEPIFMEEVNRFIQTEIERMKGSLNENQSLYIGSIIGAAYIAGFLISREVNNQIFGKHFEFKRPVRNHIDRNDIEKLIDKGIDGGRSYKEIAKVIERSIKGELSLKNDKKKEKPKNKGKRLDLGDLG